MHQVLNTLYIMTEGAFVHLDHETLLVKCDGETKLQVPLHHLGAVVCFGNIMMSPAAMHRCAEDGRSVVLLDHNGRFKARLVGPTSGNVLLRKAQYQAHTSPQQATAIGRNLVAGKLHNTRQVLLRGAREAEAPEDQEALQQAAQALAAIIPQLAHAADLDTVRGKEGEAALAYFSVLGRLVRQDRETFRFEGRNRRPPRDPLNALMSFLYALLLNDCVAACEGVGLDPQVGYLHAVRPGRPSLALDMMEEFRAVLADRLALTLINRRQVTGDSFTPHPGGAVLLSDEGRKLVVVAYQERKGDHVRHPLLDQDMPLGLVPHTQARLLARHLRGDMEQYVPFLYR